MSVELVEQSMVTQASDSSIEEAFEFKESVGYSVSSRLAPAAK